MNPTIVGFAVFAVAMGGALLGLRLAKRIPDHELDGHSRESIKLAVGLIATMTALVLGLVTASAKSTFDSLTEAVNTSAIKLLTLDRTLARYGPETAEIRAEIKRVVEIRVERTWPSDASRASRQDVLQHTASVEGLGNRILALASADPVRAELKGRAVAQVEEILEERWLLVAGNSGSVPLPFLAVLILWIMVSFTIYGLLSPSNRTVISAFAACALSVGTALFLILEMDGPFEGVLTVSGDPLRRALEQLGA